MLYYDSKCVIFIQKSQKLPTIRSPTAFSLYHQISALAPHYEFLTYSPACNYNYFKHFIPLLFSPFFFLNFGKKEKKFSPPKFSLPPPPPPPPKKKKEIFGWLRAYSNVWTIKITYKKLAPIT